MCFSTPKIKTPEAVIPAALPPPPPPPIDEDKVKGTVSFGSSTKTNSKLKGKDSLKIKKKVPTTPSVTGANTATTIS